MWSCEVVQLGMSLYYTCAQHTANPKSIPANEKNRGAIPLDSMLQVSKCLKNNINSHGHVQIAARERLKKNTPPEIGIHTGGTEAENVYAFCMLPGSGCLTWHFNIMFYGKL